MDIQTYEKIYSVLESSNLKSVSKDFCVEEGVLSNILNQKMVRSNKALYHRVAKDADTLLKRWEGGESFVSLSRKTGFSPVLMSLILLKRRGMTRREIQKMLRNPDAVEDKRLRKELSAVVKKDFLFSPRAHSLQREKARIGEEVIRNWLLQGGSVFLTEKEIKKRGYLKTPDFLLNGPLKVDGMDINWVDSKGLFGDGVEHRRLLKKQLLKYIELFGTGMVVYWYGFVDSIAEIEPMMLIKDNTYFGVDNAKDVR